MRLLQPITEDEMIAIFLRAELDSGRYGEKLHGFLVRDGREPMVLSHPNVEDPDEQAYRRALLEEHRAYERREGLFGGFPREVDWFRAVVAREELLKIRYIDWEWWLMVSGGTRSPVDAARRIRAGEIAGETAEEYEPYVASPQPELIVVTTPNQLQLVVLEGHVRLTAYAVFPKSLPAELEIVLGVSAELPSWPLF